MSAIQTERMNPRNAECEGFYLYGSGWFAEEDRRIAILQGTRTESNFCHACPVRKRCEDAHGKRVRQGSPHEVELFEKRVERAHRRGFSRTFVAAALARIGKPDPYLVAALQNYHRGVNDRRSQGGNGVSDQN